jgi:REP element-mobilizing transposase RayT
MKNYKEKNLKAYHITWVTHNTRVSERMVYYNIKKGKPVILSEKDEIEIAKILSEIIIEDNLRVAEFNICRDHIHLLLVCEEKNIINIIRKIKGKITQIYKKKNKINKSFSLWAQKFSITDIENDEKFLNIIEYIKNNRKKHNLPENKGLQPLVTKCKTSIEKIFIP